MSLRVLVAFLITSFNTKIIYNLEILLTNVTILYVIIKMY